MFGDLVNAVVKIVNKMKTLIICKNTAKSNISTFSKYIFLQVKERKMTE
jgi:hypothetical protein